MAAHSLSHIIEHQLIHLVNTGFDRLAQATTAHDSIKFERYVFFLKRFQYYLLAKLKLLHKVLERRQLFASVHNLLYKNRFLVVINRDLS